MLAGVGMAEDGFDPLTNRLDHQSDLQRDHGLQKLMGTIKKTEKVGAKDRDQQTLIVQLKTQKQEKNMRRFWQRGTSQRHRSSGWKQDIVWGRLVIDGDDHLFMAHRLWIAGGTIDIKRQEENVESR